MLKLEIKVPAEFKDLDIDVEEILDESASFLLHRIQQRFLSEKSPAGTPWIPSRAGTRRRAQGGTGTLFDTGNLYRSIQVFKTKAGQRKIGTDISYAEKHQKGLMGMIARPFLGFSTEDETLVHKIVEMRIQEKLK